MASVPHISQVTLSLSEQQRNWKQQQNKTNQPIFSVQFFVFSWNITHELYFYFRTVNIEAVWTIIIIIIIIARQKISVLFLLFSSFFAHFCHWFWDSQRFWRPKWTIYLDLLLLILLDKWYRKLCSRTFFSILFYSIFFSVWCCVFTWLL